MLQPFRDPALQSTDQCTRHRSPFEIPSRTCRHCRGGYSHRGTQSWAYRFVHVWRWFSPLWWTGKSCPSCRQNGRPDRM